MTTYDKKAKTLLLHEIKAEYDSSEKMLELHSEAYQETGDPMALLAAFCYQVATKADSGGSVSIPQWMSTPLAKGFAAYLDELFKGEDASLERSLGITDEFKLKVRRVSDLGQATVIDDMVLHVHIMRWLFYGGKHVAQACAVTYDKFESKLARMGLNLEAKGITQNADNFTQHYQRRHSKRGYPAWEKLRNPAQRTEQHRQQMLSTMPKDVADRIVSCMKPL